MAFHPQTPRPRAAIIGLTLVIALGATVPPDAGAAPPTVPPARPAGPSAADTYGVPLRPRPTVVRGFDNPTSRWLAGHRGVDLAAHPNAPVFAAGSGVVRFAGLVASTPTVSILHADGVITTYEPVTAMVRSGDRVSRGEQIGIVVTGHPGCAASACLHWGARRGAGHAANYLNPLALVGAVRVRLKPLGD